jgi:predicted small lipoprotein YifL
MVILSACGQKGALYHPTEPAAANRATLPQAITPDILKPAEKPTSTP